jgi:hypothetical protein
MLDGLSTSQPVEAHEIKGTAAVQLSPSLSELLRREC